MPTVKLPYISATVKYNQVFIDKNGFLPRLSILDLIFNEGPLSMEKLKSEDYQDSL